MQQLFEVLKTKVVSDLEDERLARDLEKIRQRFLYREYATTDFTWNAFNIAERTQEFFGHVETFSQQAQTWARIFDVIKINEYSNVIDLCPGWSPKIPLGLYYSGFKGKITIMDRSAENVGELQKFMKLFRPSFSMESFQLDLLKPFELCAPLVLASHVIDDLVIDLAGRILNIDTSRIYMDEAVLRACWNQILSHQHLLKEESVRALCAIIEKIVMPGGRMILTHYHSYLDRLLQLDDAVVFCCEILNEVVQNLCLRGFLQDSQILDQALRGYAGYFGAQDGVILVRQMS